MGLMATLLTPGGGTLGFTEANSRTGLAELAWAMAGADGNAAGVADVASKTAIGPGSGKTVGGASAMRCLTSWRTEAASATLPWSSNDPANAANS